MHKRLKQVGAAFAGWLIVGAPFAFLYQWLGYSDFAAGIACAAGMAVAGALMLVQLAKD